MLKYLALLLFAASAVAQPFPARPGPVIISQPSTGGSSSGGVDTNAVIALIEQYGGGGITSNAVVELVVDTWYTNGADAVIVEAQVELNNSSALMIFSVKDTNSAVVGFLPGSAAWNEFGNASKYAFANVTSPDIVQSLGGYVPAYAAFRYYASGTTAALYQNAPNGTRLVYFGAGAGEGGSGISSATATNIAAYQAYLATNNFTGGVSAAQVAALMATNLGNATLQNVNQGFFPRVSNAIKSNLPVRILNIGDDQVQPVNAMQYALTNFLSSRTSGLTTGGSYFYRTAAGTYAERSGYQASQDGLLPVQTIRMGNGASFTNASTLISGFPTTRITLNYYQSNNFGSITIQTQAFGGTIGTFRTVSANNSGALTYAYTNWDITLATNLIVSAVSSGTNIVIAAGQINTNAGSLWSWDDYETGNIALSQMTATALSSNAVRSFFASNNWDLIIIHDINGSSGSAASNEWWTAAVNFETAIAGCNSDIVYWTPQRVIGANEISAAQRDAMLITARTYNRPLFDAYNVTYPDSRSLSNGLYVVDGVHLSDAGSFYVTTRFLRDFGLSADAVAALAPPIRFGVDVSGKANLAGGNNFTGAQTMNSTLTVGSSLSTTGSVAGLYFQNRKLSTEFGRLFASGNALYLVQSAWATDKGIVITNDGGKLTLYADPAFFWTTDTPRLGLASSPWWLVSTNAQLLGVTRYTHTPPAQIILPAANGVVTWCSNAFLYSIHNVGGTYTTNLIQGP